MKSTTTIATAAFLAIGCFAAAPCAQAQSGPNTADSRAENDARAATMRALSRPISVELNDASLENIFQFVRDFSGAEIDVLWLDDTSADGLQKDQQVSITVKNITVLDFIERLISKTQSEFSPVAWQFSRDGHSIEVGPKSRLNAKAYLKMYDINDLLFQIPNFTDSPRLDLDQVLNQGQQGSSGGGGGIFEGGDDENGGQGPTTEELATRTISIVTENIEPEQWQDNGGSGGTIRFYNGYLLVRAPDYIQRQLSGYPAPKPIDATANSKPAAQ